MMTTAEKEATNGAVGAAIIGAARGPPLERIRKSHAGEEEKANTNRSMMTGKKRDIIRIRMSPMMVRVETVRRT